MKIKKYISLFLISLLIVTMFSACSKTNSINQNNNANNTTENILASKTESEALFLVTADDVIKCAKPIPKEETIINEFGEEEIVTIVTPFTHEIDGNYGAFSGTYSYAIEDNEVVGNSFSSFFKTNIEETEEEIIVTDEMKKENEKIVNDFINILKNEKKQHPTNNESYTKYDLDGEHTIPNPSYDEIIEDFHKLIILENGLYSMEIYYSNEDYVIRYSITFTDVGKAELMVVVFKFATE